MWGLDSIGLYRICLPGLLPGPPFAKVTSEEASKFIQEITHRFGVPNRIITDLGSAFTGSAFWDFCQDNMIDVYYSSVAHPRCNGQVERDNDMVLQALKDHIFDDTSNYVTTRNLGSTNPS
jgi:transposase InsO family protein